MIIEMTMMLVSTQVHFGHHFQRVCMDGISGLLITRILQAEQEQHKQEYNRKGRFTMMMIKLMMMVTAY